MVNPEEMHDGISPDGLRSWQMVYLDPQLRGLMQRIFSEIPARIIDDTALEEVLLLCLMQVMRFHLCTQQPLL